MLMPTNLIVNVKFDKKFKNIVLCSKKIETPCFCILTYLATSHTFFFIQLLIMGVGLSCTSWTLGIFFSSNGNQSSYFINILVLRELGFCFWCHIKCITNRRFFGQVLLNYTKVFLQTLVDLQTISIMSILTASLLSAV